MADAMFTILALLLSYVGVNLFLFLILGNFKVRNLFKFFKINQ